MTWRCRAHSPEAVAFLRTLTAEVERHRGATRGRAKKRRYTRPETARAKDAAILERFVGDLLVHASDRRMSHRPVSPNAFKDAPVGYRGFTAIREALAQLGYLRSRRGYARVVSDFSPNGEAVPASYEPTRFLPSPSLIAAARAHGVALEKARAHFRVAPPPRDLADAELVQVRTASATVRRGPGLKPLRVPPKPVPDWRPGSDLQAFALARIKRRLAEFNRFCDGHAVTHGPASDPARLRPQLYRVFTHREPLRFDLHGRHYALHGDYQALPRADAEWGRPSLRINGEPLAEVDARASHLSLLLGRLGLSLDPASDPYQVEGFDRETVKAFVTATVGNGAPPRAWSARAREEAREAGRTLPAKAGPVREAVMARYPFLARLPDALGCPENPRLCSHVVMGWEAEVLSEAMTALRDDGTLALPLHDALLVPTGDAAAAAVKALERAYQDIGRARVLVRVKT